METMGRLICLNVDPDSAASGYGSNDLLEAHLDCIDWTDSVDFGLAEVDCLVPLHFDHLVMVDLTHLFLVSAEFCSRAGWNKQPQRSWGLQSQVAACAGFHLRWHHGLTCQDAWVCRCAAAVALAHRMWAIALVTLHHSADRGLQDANQQPGMSDEF